MDKTTFFNNMVPGEMLSYKFVIEEELNAVDLSGTTIVGCTIQDSIFKDVDFISSDFDGTILSHCKFFDGKWTRSDCCSLTAADTTFSNIDFTLSTMRSCEFNNCTFIKCTFEHIALSGSRFNHCHFNDIHLVHSSTYLNTYSNCFFEECDYRGNFYYNLFINNQYIHTSYHKKLFSYNYFHMSENIELSQIGFTSEKCEELIKELRDNKLLLNLVLLELNQTNDMDMALTFFIYGIRNLLELNVLIREEQLDFLQKLLQYAIEVKNSSAVTIAEMLSCLEEMTTYFENNPNSAYYKCKETLNLIKNTLYMAYQEIAQDTLCFKDKQNEGSEKIVKIVYGEEPQIPICDIINEIKNALRISAPDAVRIKTEYGSFHEWISCYDSVLNCLQLFVAVLGIGYTVLKDHQHEQKKLKEVPADKDSSEQMLLMLNKALSKQKINPDFNQTVKIMVKNEIIASKKFRGYSKTNIYSIDIISKDN